MKRILTFFAAMAVSLTALAGSTAAASHRTGAQAFAPLMDALAWSGHVFFSLSWSVIFSHCFILSVQNRAGLDPAPPNIIQYDNSL